MRRDELVEALRSSLFKPFRVYTTEGGTFEVRHPEMMIVSRHSAVIGILESIGKDSNGDEGYPNIDRFTTVDLLHIARIEDVAKPKRGRSK